MTSGDSAIESAIVSQSAIARNGLFAFLEAAFVLAFLRGVPNATTTAGRIAAALSTTAAAVGIALLWRQAERFKSRLEITSGSIALMTRAGSGERLERADGEELHFAMRGRSRYRVQVLEQVGTDNSLPLQWYSRRPVAEACRVRGWRFSGEDRPVAPSSPPDPASLPSLIDDGLRMVRERQQRSGLDIYVSIERQLEYLQPFVQRRERPPEDKLESLTLGVYAAREFETSDPAFADVLFRVNYLAVRL